MVKTITTVAGNGSRGYKGDTGLALDSFMDNPFHVDLDRAERYLFIADCFNYCVRMVDLKTNLITTIAGTGNPGYSGDGGPAIEADIDEIYAVQVAGNGDVYIVQRFHPAVRKVDHATGLITTVAGDGTVGYGGDDGLAIRAQLREPNDCALDTRGGLLIADVQDQKIRRLDLGSGTITTFAGTGEKINSGDGGLAVEAGILGARAVCVAPNGEVYICEREGNAIRMVDTEGVIHHIAGGEQKGYSGDGGPAIEATFNGPKAIRCDHFGNVLVVDTENHSIRKIDTRNGLISTVAGGQLGPQGDGEDAVLAGLARPHGVVADSRGAFYIADSENHRIRLAV
jgi:hypothetical protein